MEQALVKDIPVSSSSQREFMIERLSCLRALGLRVITLSPSSLSDMM